MVFLIFQNFGKSWIFKTPGFDLKPRLFWLTLRFLGFRFVLVGFCFIKTCILNGLSHSNLCFSEISLPCSRALSRTQVRCVPFRRLGGISPRLAAGCARQGRMDLNGCVCQWGIRYIICSKWYLLWGHGKLVINQNHQSSKFRPWHT